MSHSKWNFEISSKLTFKSVQNYFLFDKYFNWYQIDHYIPKAMFTDEMTILILEFCECDVRPSMSHLQLSHSQFSTLDFDNNNSVQTQYEGLIV